MIARMTALVLSLTIGLSMTPRVSWAASDQLNVQEFLTFCNAAPGSSKRAYCAGYVTGVFELMAMNGLNRSHNDELTTLVRSICFTGTEDTKIIDVFKNWAKAHNEKRNELAPVGIMEALSETWPCK